MWAPHVTVAVVIEQNGKFLMVEEMDHGKSVINQPAGHVEDGESILDAAIRETLEETCWEVELRSSLGITRFIAPNGHTYFRHSFSGKALRERQDVIRDPDITNVLWLSPSELEHNIHKMRSPMVLNDITRYTSSASYPLELYCDKPV